jgi:hypothetical protein
MLGFVEVDLVVEEQPSSPFLTTTDEENLTGTSEIMDERLMRGLV